jgi:single-strand DNA-binding protein
VSSVTVVGNVGRDPELRFTPNGKAVCSFSVAENRKNKSTNETQSSWYDVICWNKLAENVAESIPKGTRVIVTGMLQQRTWEDAQGGKHSKVEIVAWQVGPDLSFATAVVTKQERQGGGDRPPPPDDSQYAGGYDEEPF